MNQEVSLSLNQNPTLYRVKDEILTTATSGEEPSQNSKLEPELEIESRTEQGVEPEYDGYAAGKEEEQQHSLEDKHTGRGEEQQNNISRSVVAGSLFGDAVGQANGVDTITVKAAEGGASSISQIDPISKTPNFRSIPGLCVPKNLARQATGVVGKPVDVFGNIVGENGEVLGRATGDLPSMVGRTVAPGGEIVGEDDEVVGYAIEDIAASQSKERERFLAREVRLDHQGNIVDQGGNVIGSFHPKPSDQKPTESHGSLPEKIKAATNVDKPGPNAETGGSPSDIFLDVKSTTEGIQLSIRIPTTFMSGQTGPKLV